MISKRIKQMMIEKGVKVKDVADKLPTVGSAQALSNKLTRDTFSFYDVQGIADILGFDVVLRDRETGKEF